MDQQLQRRQMSALVQAQGNNDQLNKHVDDVGGDLGIVSRRRQE